jgi:hypothetical protein
MQNDESLNPVNSTVSPADPDETASVLNRRKALEKLGKLAYTAPVLMKFLLSNRASAASCPGGQPPGDPGGTC